MTTDDLIRRYGGPVPRYTSYPTAPHFHAGVNATDYADWLGAVADDASLSLYFHVPFCARMCWYCGCHTKVVNSESPIHAYARGLLTEIDLVADAIPGRPRVAHVHFGGGTPTMLADADFACIMGAVAARFRLAPGAEIAIEIDPRTMTEEKARALAACGVTRASLGVQDVNEKVQTAVNRIQPFDTVARVAGWLDDAGIKDLNVDLMYGLPHQTAADVVATVDAVTALVPDRIALFGYAHVPWMKRHQRLIDAAALPGAHDRLVQADAAARRLEANGFRRIGLDHFARPTDAMARAQADGTLRRNFQGYTTDASDALIGLGASSIGALPQGYVQNKTSIRDWHRDIAEGRFAAEKGLRLDADDRMRRTVIERLMCDMRVDLDSARREHGNAEETFGDELGMLGLMANDDLVALDGNVVTVTEKGRPWLRAVAAVFDRYLRNGAGRHSIAV